MAKTEASKLIENVSDLDVQQSRRDKVIRQGRIELLGDDAYLIVKTKKYEIYDITPFGIAVLADSEFAKLDSFQDIEIVYKNQLINIVHLRIVRKDVLPNSQIKFACEIIGEPIDVEKIKAIRVANLVVQKHKTSIESFAKLPENFKRLVFEMKDWLEMLRSHVNAIDCKLELNRSDEYLNFENSVAATVGEYIVRVFEDKYRDVEKSLKGCNKETLMSAFEFFRSKIKELLLESPFHSRAFNKPLGYAGDYQMMNQIYSFEGIGSSLFAKCLQLYFISAPESRAVRNRAIYLQQKIMDLAKSSKKKIKVLSVASGPAMEVQYIIKKHPELCEKIEFNLLDQDLESLQHAQRTIKNIEREGNVKVNCQYINKAIKHVIAGGLGLKDIDLIYSAGLFDYFSDPVAQICAQKLFDGLSEDGKLIIGNFSTSSPGKITMDIALDWHLIYRSNEDLERLFKHIGNTFFIEHEEEGINLFCHLSRK